MSMCFSNVSANVSGRLGTFQRAISVVSSRTLPSAVDKVTFPSSCTTEKLEKKTGNDVEFETFLFIFQHVPES